MTLGEGEQARIRRRQTDNAEAYELFLRGMEHWRHYNKTGYDQARRLWQKALALDPNYGAALMGLGWTHRMAARWSEDPDKDNARAAELAQKALAIDDTNSDAYTLLGYISLGKRQYEQAIAYGEKPQLLFAVKSEPQARQE